MVVDRDEIGGPEQRRCRLRKAKRLEVDGGLGLELLLHVGVRETRLTGLVDRGLGLAANTADADIVLNTVELKTDHLEASLALVNAGQEALVDHQATGLPAALEVLTGALRKSRCPTVVAAVDAELAELCDGVLLNVVVVGLLQDEHLVVGCDLVAVVLAVVARLKLDDPDALTC